MTLTLSPDMENRLRSLAAQRGLPPEETFRALLTEAEAAAFLNETQAQEILAQFKASREDYAAGRWISIEDYEAQVQAKRAERASQEK